MKKFKKVYTVAQARKDPRVDDMYSEFGNMDGNKYDWWIHLKGDYICDYMGCHTIHEQTVNSCLDLLNNDVVTAEEYYSKWPDHPWHKEKKW